MAFTTRRDLLFSAKGKESPFIEKEGKKCSIRSKNSTFSSGGTTHEDRTKKRVGGKKRSFLQAGEGIGVRFWSFLHL